MNKTLVFGVILAAAIAGFAGAHFGKFWSPGPSWAGGWGPGMMRGLDEDEIAQGWGRGMMGRGGYGPGYDGGYGPRMMGPGFGQGMMGRGDWDEGDDLNLTADQVTRRFERRLARHGNDRVKLGAVTEKDEHTITVDIVTTDKGGLVQRLGIDRKTGRMRPIDG